MRILIVDDSGLVRRGVAGLLSGEPGWEVCGEAGDGAQAIQMARDLLPDLILIDISMPGIHGLEAVRLIRQKMSGVKILVMSQHDPVHLLPGVIAAGAQACVDKSRLGLDLLPAIKSVAYVS
jgi:DNA-binding NarL/FixJ family response regulator